MPAKKAITMDELLAKKRREDASALASRIMGKKRTAAKVPQKPASGSGVAKKPVQQQQQSQSQHPPAIPTGPAASIDTRWRHDRHHLISGPKGNRITKSTPQPSAISASTKHSLQNNKLYTAIHNSGQVNTNPTPIPTGPSRRNTRSNNYNKPANNGPPPAQQGDQQQPAANGGAQPKKQGISIRGTAGPTVIHASNFAPGTTAEDIKHAMEPLGTLLNCIIVTAEPTVLAEIVFEKREPAEQCIAQYNGQRADGRVLHVYMKNGPPIHKIPQPGQPARTREEDEFERERAEADRLRRERNSAQVSYQDGRYGFPPPQGLYSDPMVDAEYRRGRGFARGY